jgi:malonyl CoA-acyl carrier protein transacylase
MRGKGYGWVDFEDDGGYIESRKLTGKQREEILANYIRRRSGRRFTVPAMAKLLGVSDRTIQKHLADLEAKGWIKRVPCFNEIGRQNGNDIVYTGPKPRLTGKELTMEKVYDPDNKAGLKDESHYYGS